MPAYACRLRLAPGWLPAGAEIDGRLSEEDWDELASELTARSGPGGAAADPLLRALRLGSTPLCCAVASGAAAAAGALVAAGASLAGAFNALCDLARSPQGGGSSFQAVTDALLSHGLPAPSTAGGGFGGRPHIPSAFHGMSGPWGRGLTWPSTASQPEASVEEAHWAAALLACPYLRVCNGWGVEFENGAPPLPALVSLPASARPRQPYLLRRLLQLHAPGGPWVPYAEQVRTAAGRWLGLLANRWHLRPRRPFSDTVYP